MTDDPRAIFAIGDIHGCHRRLEELLVRLPMDRERDALVFLGDYINRGPDSRLVIETLLRVREDYPRSVFLMGNHEEMLLSYGATGDVERFRLLQAMGVQPTLASYSARLRDVRGLDFLPFSHLEFLHALRLSWRVGSFLFTHADIVAPAERAGRMSSSLDCLLSSRRLAREEADVGGDVVVFGHTPFAMPLVMPGRIGIDTGAVYGGLLTAVELPALRFYHS